MLAGKVGHETAVLTHELSVLPLYLIKPDTLIFFMLSDFTQVRVEILKIITLFAFQLLRQLLIERVFLLEERELLCHLLILEVVRATLLFDL